MKYVFAGEGKLPQILQFITGLKDVPALGFTPPLTIVFKHDDQSLGDHHRGIPFANTCANQLALPVGQAYNDFKNVMNTAIFEIGCLFLNE